MTGWFQKQGVVASKVVLRIKSQPVGITSMIDINVLSVHLELNFTLQQWQINEMERACHEYSTHDRSVPSTHESTMSSSGWAQTGISDMY